MANNYWMIVQTEENYKITSDRGFDLVGLTKRQRKRAQRIEPEDRLLLYLGYEKMGSDCLYRIRMF